MSTPKKQDINLSYKKKLKFTDMTRRKFTSKFRNKVVLEALKEREIAKELLEVPKVDNHSILLLGDNKNE